MQMRVTAALLLTFAVMTGCASVQTTPGRVWSHEDIAAFLNAANDGEIQQGQVAVARASSAEVRAFAQMMVNDHTAANTRGHELFVSRGIIPSDNETARTLQQNSAEAVAALSSHSGASFDRQYMQTQVALHEWLLNTLDVTVIPSATDREVRELLTTQRASVAAHLDRARSIADTLR